MCWKVRPSPWRDLGCVGALPFGGGLHRGVGPSRSDAAWKNTPPVKCWGYPLCFEYCPRRLCSFPALLPPPQARRYALCPPRTGRLSLASEAVRYAVRIPPAVSLGRFGWALCFPLYETIPPALCALWRFLGARPWGASPILSRNGRNYTNGATTTTRDHARRCDSPRLSRLGAVAVLRFDKQGDCETLEAQAGDVAPKDSRCTGRRVVRARCVVGDLPPEGVK